ncbi:MAG: alpha/beta fold hydrolase [Pirellulales bacterium]
MTRSSLGLPGFWLLVLCWLAGGSTSWSQEDRPAAQQQPQQQQQQAAERRWQLESTGQNRWRITLPANGGNVSTEHLLGALAEVAAPRTAGLVDLLPAKELNLNDSASTWTLLALNLLGDGDFRARIVEDAQQTPQALVIELDGDQLEQNVAAVKSSIRAAVTTATPTSPNDDRFGITWLEPLAKPTDGRPVVLVLHGYNAGPETLQGMLDALRERHFVYGYFVYPNDGPIPDAAVALRHELEQLAKDHPDIPVALVTHSMGGLVARAVLESPEFTATNVRRLIMIAPPNQGSLLARVPISFDLYEHLVNRGTQDPLHLLRDAATDGMNEARPQLKPGSAFLTALNGRARNPRVDYTVILGSGAVLDRDQLKEFSQKLKQWRQRLNLPDQLEPVIELLVDPPDEILRGRGDGVVAVERGRLEGVADTLVLPITHWTFIDIGLTDASQVLLDAVLARLK